MITFNVPDMSCGHCVSVITKAIKTLDTHSTVQCDLERHQVNVTSAVLEPTEVRDAIAEAGYSPQSSEA